MEQDSSQDDILKLRKRVQDLLALGYMTQESAGTYEQTMLQFCQEVDRRKQSCFQRAETLRLQASAAEAQGHAFSAMASILYSVVNGFYEAGRKRLQEEAERESVIKAQELEKMKEEVELAKEAARSAHPPLRKRGRKA
jgi:hypothetical protein